MFEIVNSILYEKTPWENFTISQQNSFTIFTLNKALSQIPAYIESVNTVNQNQVYLTNELVYNFYKNKFPKRRIYTKYVKKSESPYTKELISFLAKRYKESKKTIEFYLQLFSKEDVQDYLIRCGLEDKEITNMLKIFRK